MKKLKKNGAQIRTSKATSAKYGVGRPKGANVSGLKSVVDVVGAENYMPTILLRLLNLELGLRGGVLTLKDYLMGYSNLYANLATKPKLKKKQKSA